MDKKMNNGYGWFAAILLIANAQFTQATPVTYDVVGVFAEPMTVIGHTTFAGTFQWDAETETISGLQGMMNETMYDPSVFPDLYLGHQLDQRVDGNIVSATVFKENTTDVFSGGGFTAGDVLRYGNKDLGPMFPTDGNEPNDNAYFTLVFDKTTMTGIIEEIVYGDCAPGGMMGEICMTGHSVEKVGYTGTMAAYPTSVTISAVPVPAAVWLFASALFGLVGVQRRHH